MHACARGPFQFPSVEIKSRTRNTEESGPDSQEKGKAETSRLNETSLPKIALRVLGILGQRVQTHIDDGGENGKYSQNTAVYDVLNDVRCPA